MPDTVMNIYKTAREVAGMTQERAAAALNLSVRSLAAYETGERIPHDDIVVRMVDLYNFQQLAVQHMRTNSELARRIIPEVRQRSMIETAVSVYNLMRRFAARHSVDRLLEIAEDEAHEDGRIDEEELPDFTAITEELRKLSVCVMELEMLDVREEEKPC